MLKGEGKKKKGKGGRKGVSLLSPFWRAVAQLRKKKKTVTKGKKGREKKRRGKGEGRCSRAARLALMIFWLAGRRTDERKGEKEGGIAHLIPSRRITRFQVNLSEE